MPRKPRALGYFGSVKANFPFRQLAVLIAGAAVCTGVRAEADESRTKRSPVESSTIASVGYLRSERVLEIEFRSGAVYRYSAVPKSVFDALISAHSKGRFFGAEIRGKYSFERLREPSK